MLGLSIPGKYLGLNQIWDFIPLLGWLGHGQGSSPDLWDLNPGNGFKVGCHGRAACGEVSGTQRPMLPMQPGVDGELSSSESRAPGSCVTARPPRLFSVENTRHLNLAFYGGGGRMEKKAQLALIKAKHLQRILKAEQTGIRTSPFTRAGHHCTPIPHPTRASPALPHAQKHSSLHVNPTS